MLHHKFFSNGHYLLRKTFHYRVSFALHRFSSYDQHESPTIAHLINTLPVLNLTEQIPSSCQVVIAGGGILGQSVAYHLAEYGAKDVVLVEKAR